MLPKQDQLKELINEAIVTLKKKYPDVAKNLSHVGFMAKDKEDYEKYRDELTKTNEFVKEVSHSGRNISLFNVKEPLTIQDLVISRIELFEPKPGSQSEESKWEHISFKVDNLEALIEKYKNTENALIKIRQIGDDKWGYHVINGIRIQFRNRYFGKSDGTPKVAATNDYKVMYEAEKEKRLRLLADMDNEKKLLQKQKEEFSQIANISIINDLFGIIDDLKRTTENNTESEQDSVNMIYNKLLGILNNYGVVPIEIKPGDAFDAQTMEAITTTKVKSEKNNKVMHVEQLGFKLRHDDRIIRPCRVVVGKSE
jgi:molecular chaperone GrpE